MPDVQQAGRVLVTGITGFTGHYLTEALAGAGHEVHGLANSDMTRAPGVARVHSCDLSDEAALARIVAEVAPTHVIHLAAIAFVGHSDIGEMYRTNVVGTRNLLEALARSDAALQAVLLVSSANIYGNARGGALDEDTPFAPVNDYGVTKVAAEYVASLYRERLPIIITRPFNYTGVGQAEQFIIPKIVAHARRNASVIELGNVDVARDFVDVRTIADAYRRLIATPEAIGGTFNLCSGEAVSLGSVIDRVRALSGVDLEVRVNPDFVRANEVMSLSGRKDRVEAVIGPLLDIPLDATLEWMLEA